MSVKTKVGSYQDSASCPWRLYVAWKRGGGWAGTKRVPSMFCYNPGLARPGDPDTSFPIMPVRRECAYS